MTFEEFNIINKPLGVITVDNLNNREDRTLIFGYDIDRRTFHLYLKNEKFNVVLYEYPNFHFSHSLNLYSVRDENCFPNKRIYPHNCDFEFCKLLLDRGNNLPFTTFEEEKRKDDQFIGLIYNELT